MNTNQNRNLKDIKLDPKTIEAFVLALEAFSLSCIETAATLRADSVWKPPKFDLDIPRKKHTL